MDKMNRIHAIYVTLSINSTTKKIKRRRKLICQIIRSRTFKYPYIQKRQARIGEPEEQERKRVRLSQGRISFPLRLTTSQLRQEEPL